MKTFIHKTNQYLLERFPNIWNTRLFWMLLAALVLHLIFFVFGFFTLSNPKLLQERYVEMLFFENGSVFLSIVISVLLLVAWLIFMFKNNAFKNFYPTNKLKLFGQFLSYLIIVFACTTFYISYQYGMKAYIASNYPDAQITKEIQIANDAALFLSEDLTDYTINNRRYPKPFYDLFCENRTKFIDYDKSYLSFEDDDYQFYTLRTEEAPISDAYNRFNSIGFENSGFVYSKTSDSIRTFFFKDSVVNVQNIIKTQRPSYYNMSSTFFVSRNDTLMDDDYKYDYNYMDYSEYDYAYRASFSIRHQLRNKRNYELLKRNDKAEIKQLMEDFLSFSDGYKIDHNLTAKTWLDLVYHPDNFEVKNFIRDRSKDDYDFGNPVAVERTKTQEFYYDRITDFHYENVALRNVFENIEDIKASDPLDSIHVFMWIAFFFASIIFIFRVTGLKQLLFSIITVGVLTLFVALISALLFYLMRSNDDVAVYFISYFTLILGSIILLIPICFSKRIKKLVVAICVNISIIGFPLYLFLIMGIISMHQNDACLADSTNYYKNDYRCDTLMNSLEFNWSWILFFAGILFLFFYSKVIKNWKSLPEG